VGGKIRTVSMPDSVNSSQAAPSQNSTESRELFRSLILAISHALQMRWCTSKQMCIDANFIDTDVHYS
jgi:hypothetical protein